jgi:hypothetical protein
MHTLVARKWWLSAAVVLLVDSAADLEMLAPDRSFHP